jgi:hypothetical protein
MAAAGLEALPALEAGLANSADPQTILEGGRPIAMFGIVDQGGGVGAPWLLGSDRILAHWFEFGRRSRAELERVGARWTVLTNYIDDRNHAHQRWLWWLGFEFMELHPQYGVGRLPFWRFEKCASPRR